MKLCDLRDLTATNKNKTYYLASSYIDARTLPFTNANLQKFSLEGVLFIFAIIGNLMAEFLFFFFAMLFLIG
jgi:hypothetical protein